MMNYSTPEPAKKAFAAGATASLASGTLTASKASLFACSYRALRSACGNFAHILATISRKKTSSACVSNKLTAITPPRVGDWSGQRATQPRLVDDRTGCCATTLAIAECRRRWNAAPKATVSIIADYRRLKWMRTYTRPMPPYRGDAA